ncbi:hypothetical protein B0T22DRAFT_436781 [Podospora appendiculata]|uniref:Uncharacterized protein n=1 Tax=Podospora appendiculata TaxID=314037 RepID=A0AAE0XHM8_9PEZI|nr:hypothetical protein B0T22DRAFT_436781 [Podospora appendiculata]
MSDNTMDHEVSHLSSWDQMDLDTRYPSDISNLSSSPSPSLGGHEPDDEDHDEYYYSLVSSQTARPMADNDRSNSDMSGTTVVPDDGPLFDVGFPVVERSLIECMPETPHINGYPDIAGLSLEDNGDDDDDCDGDVDNHDDTHGSPSYSPGLPPNSESDFDSLRVYQSSKQWLTEGLDKSPRSESDDADGEAIAHLGGYHSSSSNGRAASRDYYATRYLSRPAVNGVRATANSSVPRTPRTEDMARLLGSSRLRLSRPPRAPRDAGREPNGSMLALSREVADEISEYDFELMAGSVNW